MKTIILPTDFSAAATHAAKYAANMALATNADLFLLHVYDLPVISDELSFLINPEELKQSAEAKILKLKSQLLEYTCGKVRIRTNVHVGKFFYELEAVCDMINPYAVVMGDQGEKGTGRLAYGSNALYAMKHLNWPLITISEDTRYTGIKKIGLVFDFEKLTNETWLDEIKSLTNDFKAEVHVLHIGRQKMYDPAIVFKPGIIQEMLLKLKPYCHSNKNANINNGIIEFIEKNDIDMLVMIPKRYSFLDKFINDSKAKQHLALYNYASASVMQPVF